MIRPRSLRCGFSAVYSLWPHFLVLLLAACLTSQISLAATYYVDGSNPSASDSNPGTQDLPWRTIQRSDISVTAGDTVIVLPGTYNERVRVSLALGTPTAPIEFRADTPRTVTMRGFALTGSNYVHIHGFNISNTIQTAALGGGIWIAANGIEVADCYFYDIPAAGVQFSWTRPWSSDCTIKDCRVYRCQYGFVVHGQNLMVKNNEVERPVQHQSGDSDYSRFFGDNITFRDNWFHGARTADLPTAHVDGFQTFSENGWGARNCTIERNRIESFHEGLQISSLIPVSPNAAVSDVTVRNNLFVGGALGGSWGIAAIDNVQNLIVYHNTFVDLAYNGVGVQHSSTATVRNNIFRRTINNYFSDASSTLLGGYNILYPASSQDHRDSSDLRNVDPKFLDYAGGDYRLDPTSPARDAAIDVGVLDDILGTVRPQGAAPDIGAYEFNVGLPTIAIGSPSVTVTGTGPVLYTVTYSNAASITLSAADVTLNSTGSAAGTVSASGSGTSTRTVTVSSITGDGSLSISILAGTAINGDGAGAPAAGPSTPFIVDSTPITVDISTPSVPITRSGPVDYTVTYDNVETVTLKPADVILNCGGSAAGDVTVTGAKADGTFVRTVTVHNITGDGSIGISLPENTATDAAGLTAPAAGPSAVFVVDNTPPQISIGHPSLKITDVGPVSYQVNYVGASSVSLTAADIFVNATGTAAFNSVQVTGTGATTRTVALGGISGDGLMSVSVATNTATDSAGNAAPSAGPSAAFMVNSNFAFLPFLTWPAILGIVVASLVCRCGRRL